MDFSNNQFYTSTINQVTEIIATKIQSIFERQISKVNLKIV